MLLDVKPGELSVKIGEQDLLHADWHVQLLVIVLFVERVGEEVMQGHRLRVVEGLGDFNELLRVRVLGLNFLRREAREADVNGGSARSASLRLVCPPCAWCSRS